MGCYWPCEKDVILPQFGDKRFDLEAMKTKQRIFPNENLGVCSREIFLSCGSIHCITQQLRLL